MIGLLIAVLYLCFISLGLPDSMLGSAWPTMFVDFNVPESYAGIISAICALGTIVSSLMSDRITKKLGASRTTVISILITALALMGFGLSTRFWMLCVLSIPYGLGAGSVDAALNNYVSLHFESKHMSWLHCMWGLGAAVGPVIMGAVLTNNMNWNSGYLIVASMQAVICFIVFLSMPIWKKTVSLQEQSEKQTAPIPLKDVLKIRGVKAVMITFFCYCAIEGVVVLWASTYLNLEKGIAPHIAASWGGLYVLGITAGRAVSGFVSIKLNDKQMTRVGEGILLVGFVMLILPLPDVFSLIALVVLGVGSAPIYPCIIHATPERFGADKSQAVIGVQMASAYTGTCLMPPLFGVIARHISISYFPLFVGALIIGMTVLFEVLLIKTKETTK